MSQRSSNLDLPLILPSQAQKHVTHNEALLLLDGLVQLALQSTGADVPPAAPAEGEAHAVGSAPTGGWAGEAGKIALWQGGAWRFLQPREGWQAWSAATQAGLVYTSGSWQALTAADLQNVDGLGIGTSYDSTNKLAVASDATLLSHDGNGHQVKVNKAAATDTASLLFQSGWDGHAEMGLAGDNDFSIKVSDDGANWTDAMRFDASTGQATGAAVQASVNDMTAGRLLVNGAYGLGETITLTSADNLDTLEASGLYFNPTGGNTPGNNYPTGWAGSLLNMRRHAGNWTQTYITYGGNSIAGHVRKYVRSMGSAGWSPWLEVMHQGRMVGAVGQSGGVPTGAAMERGSNANGEYVRFADGTQICHGSIVTSASGGVSWSFPAAFATSSNLSVQAMPVVAIGTATIANCNAISVSAASLRAYNTSNTQLAVALRLTATGRWF